MSSNLKYHLKVEKDEHDSDAPATKKVLIYGDNSGTKKRIAVNADGKLIIKTT